MSVAAPSGGTYARDVDRADTLLGAFQLFCRFPTPRFLMAKCAAFAVWRMTMGGFTTMDLVFVGAVAVYWPFQEWLFHCTLLHFKPRVIFGFKVDLYMGKVHRYHHRHPWLVETTFLPLRAMFVLAPIHVGLWWWLSPTLELACTGIAAFTLASVIYEWVHYLTHTPYRPRGSYYRTIWRNHRLHHFKNERYWHSFTVPVIDVMFGTCPEAKEVPTSDTCYTLGVDDDF